MPKSESKLLGLAERHCEEQMQPASPDRSMGSQAKQLRAPGKAAKLSRSKAQPGTSQQQSSAAYPEYRSSHQEASQRKPKMGQKFIQGGHASAFATTFAEPDTSHLLPRSHALAQMQHHNEILSQISGSRAAQLASAIQGGRKGTNSKQGKETEGSHERLGKIVDQKLYTKATSKIGAGREKVSREKTSTRRSAAAHVPGTNSATKLPASSAYSRGLPQRSDGDASEPYTQHVDPITQGRIFEYGMGDPEQLASERHAYSTFSGAASGQKVPGERLLDQSKLKGKNAGRHAHELTRQLESAQTYHAQSDQAADAAYLPQGGQQVIQERLQAVSLAGSRGRDLARVESTSTESQQWEYNQSAAAYGVKPLPRVDQLVGSEIEPYTTPAARPLNKKRKAKGGEVSVAKQQQDQAVLYVGSRGSHQPGSLGGFTGVTALDIGNESVFTTSKQARQKSKPKQRMKRDKSGPRGGDTASSRAGVFETSEYAPGAYYLPHQADQNMLSRKNSQKSKGGIEGTQQTTKLPLLHQSPQTTRKEDIAQIFGLSNFYESHKQPIRTYKQQLFVNQTKARTRIILPPDREPTTADREKETTASTNIARSQITRTISKLQKPSQDLVNSQKNMLDEVSLAKDSVYAMSAEGVAFNNINNSLGTPKKSEFGLIRKQPLVQDRVHQATQQNQSHYDSIKRLENDIKLKKEILMNLSQSENHPKSKVEILKRGKPTSQPNPNRDCLRTITNSRDLADALDKEPAGQHASLFLPVKGAEAVRNKERSQLAYQTAYNFGSKQFQSRGVEFQKQGDIRANIISAGHSKQMQPFMKPNKPVDLSGDYLSIDDENFFNASIALSGAAPKRSCFDQKSIANAASVPLGLSNSLVSRGPSKLELQPRGLLKVQPASHLMTKQHSLPQQQQRRLDQPNPLRASIDDKNKVFSTKKSRQKLTSSTNQINALIDAPVPTTSYKNDLHPSANESTLQPQTRNLTNFESNPLQPQSKKHILSSKGEENTLQIKSILNNNN